MCNSGSANYSVANSNGDGRIYVDIIPTTLNVDAPVMTNKIINLTMNSPTSRTRMGRWNSAGSYTFVALGKNTTLDLFIGGVEVVH